MSRRIAVNIDGYKVIEATMALDTKYEIFATSVSFPDYVDEDGNNTICNPEALGTIKISDFGYDQIFVEFSAANRWVGKSFKPISAKLADPIAAQMTQTEIDELFEAMRDLTLDPAEYLAAVDPTNSQECSHEYAWYEGLTDKYHYCVKCDKKGK